MNKKIKILLAIISVIAIVVVFHKEQKIPVCQSLLLQNIEAIAWEEIGTGYCVGTGDVDCPLAGIKVDYYVNYSLPLEKY